MTDPKMDALGSDRVVVSHSQHGQVLKEGLWNFLATKYQVEDVPISGGLLQAHSLILDVFLPPKKRRGTSAKVSADRQCHLEELLQFLYLGTVTVNRKQLGDLLRLAEDLHFELLVDAVKAVGSEGNGDLVDEPEGSLGDLHIPNVWSCVTELETESETEPKGQTGEQSTDSAKTVSKKAAREVWARKRKRLKVENSKARTGKDSRSGRNRMHQSSSIDLVEANKCVRTKVCGPRLSALKKRRNLGHLHKKDAVVPKEEEDEEENLLTEDERVEEQDASSKTRLRGVRPKLKCGFCQYQTTVLARLRLHEKTEHDPSILVLYCETCGKPSFSEESLMEHVAQHLVPKHYCSHCEFATPKKRSFDHHMYVAHLLNPAGVPLERKYRCLVSGCNFAGVYASELKNHNLTKHLKDRPFACDQCDYTANRQGDIGKHRKIVHLGVMRQHMCEQCGHRCHSKSALEDHVRKHSVERPFRCDRCPLLFKHTKALKRHQVKHEGTEERFCCPECGHSFNRKYNLAVHLRNVHKAGSD